jgi:hypothetical protein
MARCGGREPLATVRLAVSTAGRNVETSELVSFMTVDVFAAVKR